MSKLFIYVSKHPNTCVNALREILEYTFLRRCHSQVYTPSAYKTSLLDLLIDEEHLLDLSNKAGQTSDERFNCIGYCQSLEASLAIANVRHLSGCKPCSCCDVGDPVFHESLIERPKQRCQKSKSTTFYTLKRGNTDYLIRSHNCSVTNTESFAIAP